LRLAWGAESALAFYGKLQSANMATAFGAHKLVKFYALRALNFSQIDRFLLKKAF
jgi:hypothetical protein